MILEGARLLEQHCSVSVASEMAHHRIKSNLYLSFFFFLKRMSTIILYISISIRYAQHVVHNNTFHVILHNVQFQCFINQSSSSFFFYLEKKRRNKKLNLACKDFPQCT